MKNKGAILVENLSKNYGDFKALKEISLKINEGEIFGLLGPNGAGKSTFIHIISTLLRPTSGTAFVNGYDITKDPRNVRKSIGLVFQDTILDLELGALDNLDFHARLYNIVPVKLKEKRINELIDLVGLSNYTKRKVETFSGGMKRRLEIARGFLHNPKVLLLDEPTLGLDPQTRRHIWEHILKIRIKEKMTILLTTHYMEEADFLCDRVAIIDKGKIIAIGKPRDLKNKLKGDIVSIQVKNLNKNLINNLKKIKHIKKLEFLQDEIKLVTTNAESKIAKFVDIAKKSKVIVQSISVHKPTLEDVFLYYTGREMRDDVS